MVLSAGDGTGEDPEVLRERETERRAAFATADDRAADQYFVRRGKGLTIVAGYPWFTDWGRDSFLALRGLAFATGRHADAAAMLLEWADAVHDGMVPNRFADSGEEPEFNSVDASLWFVIVVCELLEAIRNGRCAKVLAAGDRERLVRAVTSILSAYAAGTRYGIRADADGLLACGVPGVQLTWMDAKVGDWVVTPRTGKPVEVQALWLGALHAASGFLPGFEELLRRGLVAFRTRFWNPERGCLYDTIDCDHVPGRNDGSLRPNQILALGGLPLNLVGRERARRILDVVERELWTPLGLRSLAPGDAAYRAHYRGGVVERDGAYHQGTVWPWLAGPFVEAWVRVRGSTSRAKREARERFLPALRAHLDEAGLGHVSEVADGDAPHAPGGCPFQAWSLGELLRLERIVLDETEDAASSARLSS